MPLDENPDALRYFVVGYNVTQGNKPECWGGDSIACLGDPPDPNAAYNRVAFVDVGKVARALRAQAAKHGITLGRFTREGETFDKDTDISVWRGKLQ